MGFFAHRRYGFGEAGDGTDPRVVGDIAFAHPVSGVNWLGDKTGDPGRTLWHKPTMIGFGPFDTGFIEVTSFYTPPSRDLISAAQLQWDKLQNHISLNSPSAARATDRLVRLRATLSAPVKLVDQLLGSGEWLPMASAFRSISDLVIQFGKESWPDPQQELEAADAQAQADADAKVAADAAAAAARATADAKAKQTQAAIAAAQAAIAAAEHAKMVAQHSAATAAAKGGGPSPLVIAAIAVPVLGVLAYAFTRRGKSVSGYRRRRRR